MNNDFQDAQFFYRHEGFPNTKIVQIHSMYNILVKLFREFLPFNAD